MDLGRGGLYVPHGDMCVVIAEGVLIGVGVENCSDGGIEGSWNICLVKTWRSEVEREREWIALFSVSSVLSLVQGSWVLRFSFGISSLCCILVSF